MKDVNHKTLGVKDYAFVPKGWGYEKWLVNKPEYCGKVLHMVKGRKFSYHCHKLKEETFFISKGSVVVRYGESADIKDSSHVILEEGGIFHIPVGLYHQIQAITDTDIIEFSTQHFDEDSYRSEKGD
jgi:mannose-6-phosphate isomerase-like protein (cupin superfamily)